MPWLHSLELAARSVSMKSPGIGSLSQTSSGTIAIGKDVSVNRYAVA